MVPGAFDGKEKIMYMYLVLNNEFNRRYYPSLIGLRFVNPPIHACASASYRPVQVRKLPVRKDRKLTVRKDAGSQVAAGEPAKPVTLD